MLQYDKPISNVWTGRLPEDPYAELGLTPAAGADEIRRAFRRLAKSHHPDANGGAKSAEERFKRLGAAWDILGDPGRRRTYDASLTTTAVNATSIDRPPPRAPFDARAFRRRSAALSPASQPNHKPYRAAHRVSPPRLWLGIVLTGIGLGLLLFLVVQTSLQGAVNDVLRAQRLTDGARTTWLGVVSLGAGLLISFRASTEGR